MSTCRSCGAEILWARTSGGKRVPLDAKPERRYAVVGYNLPLEEAPSSDAPVVALTDTYVTHFATCPDADSWRRGYDG